MAVDRQKCVSFYFRFWAYSLETGGLWPVGQAWRWAPAEYGARCVWGVSCVCQWQGYESHVFGTVVQDDHAFLCPALPCHAMPCHALLCSAWGCCAMPCL